MTARSSGGQSAKVFDILLPSDNLELQNWRLKEGSLVRKGETVAVARTKDARSSTSSASPPPPSAAAAAAAAAATATASHKRPNRRRRVGPTAAGPAPVATGAPSKQKTSHNPIASIQQRLAEKLSCEKAAGKGAAAVASSSSSPSSADSSTSSASGARKDADHPILAPATGILRTAPNSKSSEASSSLAIGYIEVCLHPAFLEGICVVCGESMARRGDDDEEGESSQSPNVPVPFSDSTASVTKPKTSQVTVSGGVTMTVSAEESRNMAQQDTERLLQQVKLSLVLDLDHTLVHATADPRAQQFRDKDDVRTLRLPAMEGMSHVAGATHPQAPMFMQHHVKLRPHIKTFLQSVQPDYELTVYTAGTRQYAEEITIVLCRHLVGSTRDIDDLERLRYEVHMAEMEFRKQQSLNESSNHLKNDDDAKKRKAEYNEDATEQPSKKRKMVSFGAPQEDAATDEMGDSKPPAKSDHMTKEKLEALKKEMEEADQLEKKAWELRKKLFGSRVVSRTDVGDLGRDVKSLKRIFPCGGTMSAVVDDREDVWANAEDNSYDTRKGEPPDNLLLVRPYHWQPFIGFADVNNVAGEDLSRTQQGSGDDSDVERDVQLVWTSRILKGLHRRYYRQEINNRKTVPELLAQMRSQVLGDSILALSGLVPFHKKSIDASAARPPIVRYAQKLGAKVSRKTWI